MPTPKQGYYNKSGKRVPGTTTIIARFKESGGLIHWSWDLAFRGLMEARAVIENGTEEERKAFLGREISQWDYRVERDKAADAGTIAHDMVECRIRRREFDKTKYDAALVERAMPAFDAFLQWAAQSELTPIETELRLVSEAYDFGGTLDAMLLSGKLALGDWKTSNRVYADNLLQLAAYGILWEEHHPDKPIEGGYHLLRFSKQGKPDDPVMFEHRFWSQLDAAKDAFLTARKLYGQMQDIGRLA